MKTLCHNSLKWTAALLTTIMMVVSCTHTDKYITLRGYAQGGTYAVKLNLNGENGRIKAKTGEIQNAVDSILNTIDTTLSGYNRKSILSRLNAGDTVKLENDNLLEDIYSRAYNYYIETEGALDVSSGPLFDIWGFGFTSDSLPSPELISSTLKNCGMSRLKPDISTLYQNGRLHSSFLLKDIHLENQASPDQALPVLNFNAIAQGYSCDLVANYLHSLGVKDMLVDIGEIYCSGVNPDGKPWRIGIDRPTDGNNSPGKDLDGIWHSDGKPCGIVTSGNYRKFYVRDGKKYAHTINPANGWPVQHNLLSATIVANNATDADAYASYCMVIGLEKAMDFLLENSDRLSGYLIWSDENGNMREWASINFTLMENRLSSVQ